MSDRWVTQIGGSAGRYTFWSGHTTPHDHATYHFYNTMLGTTPAPAMLGITPAPGRSNFPFQTVHQRLHCTALNSAYMRYAESPTTRLLG